MSKSEILAELPHLLPAELAEVQAKLDKLTGESLLDHGDLTEADKSTLDAELDAYKKSPDAGSPWAEVKARSQTRLRP